MTFTITTDSKSRIVTLQLQNLNSYTKKGIRSAFYQVGAISKSIIREEISRVPRFGREEVFRGKKRRASLPGEAFANRSGDAKRTIKFEVHGTYEVEWGFGRNEKTIYTKILEETMRANHRPTLRISSDRLKGNAYAIMIKELQKSLTT